jgi:AcrR family transcriptional regulator
MRSKSEARILQAAIELFAECGYAAGAREIAQRAGSTTMTMYRAFRNRKEFLFEEALREVISRSFDPARFVLFIFVPEGQIHEGRINDGQKSGDLISLLANGLQRWYLAIQPADARLIEQARLSNNAEWRATASSALEKIIDILATTIQRQLPKKPKQDFDAATAARAVITVLFQAKLAHAATAHSQKASREEAREVEGLLSYCFAGLACALKE